MPKLKFLQLLASISMAILLSSNLMADKTTTPKEAEPQKFYDIEIIVFKNKSVPKGHELNLPTPLPGRTETTVDLAKLDSIEQSKEKGFVSLLNSEFRLLETVRKIISSSRYDLLSHSGWRQPGLDEKESVPVWIKGGTIFGNAYSSIDQADSLSTPPSPANNTEQASNDVSYLKDVFYELEGLVTVSLSRYLHVQSDLVLRKPAKMPQFMDTAENLSDGEIRKFSGGGRLLNYGLKEKRRMRSKRLHYLDHPQFGMLVLITPYEPPEVEDIPEEVAIEVPPTTPIATEN